jgi:hypothetical protein
MLSWIIRNRLAAFERTFSYDLSYARDILAADRRAFFALARIGSISSYRRDVPRDVYYAAKLVSTLAEDCGPCTQLIVTMGLRDGADPRMLAAVVRGDEAAMTDEVRLGAAFARAALAHDPAADELREDVQRRWGRRALISLGFAIVAGRIYPTLKYALGHGKACQRVLIAGETIAPRAHVA